MNVPNGPTGLGADGIDETMTFSSLCVIMPYPSSCDRGMAQAVASSRLDQEGARQDLTLIVVCGVGPVNPLPIARLAACNR